MSLPSTRRASRCSAARRDLTARQFKSLLADKFDIQLNKTSRNRILLQSNINNTRSDIAYLIKVLADIARDLEKRSAANRSEQEKASFDARVKSLCHDLPDLPNFSRFHDVFRENPKSKTTRATCAHRSSWPTTRPTVIT